MSDDDGAKETVGGDEQLELLREIRDLHKEMLAVHKSHNWVLLPIFTLLAIMLILGLTGFF